MKVTNYSTTLIKPPLTFEEYIFVHCIYLYLYLPKNMSININRYTDMKVHVFVDIYTYIQMYVCLFQNKS